MRKLKKIASVLLIMNMLFISPTQVLAESIGNVEDNSQNEVTSQLEQEQDVKDSGMQLDDENIQESKISEEDISGDENESQTDNNAKTTEISTTQNENNEELINKVIDYVYVESTEVEQGEIENIAISFLNRETDIDKAELTLKDSKNNEIIWSMTKYREGILLFSENTDLDIGTYSLETLTYEHGEEKFTVDFQREGINGEFSVVETDGKATEEAVDTTVQVIDDNGNVQEASSIQEGIALAQEYSGDDEAESVKDRKSQNGNTVIVLDPGHDNMHTGAAYGGINEEKYTLQIAKACRAELEKYNGVEVYMTVQDNGNTQWDAQSSSKLENSTCLKNRVAYAKS